MPLHLHIDPFSGIAGDMFLGALIDLGVDPKVLEQHLGRAGMEDRFHLTTASVLRHGIGAVDLKVIIDPGPSADGRAGSQSRSQSGAARPIPILTPLEPAAQPSALVAHPHGQGHGHDRSQGHGSDHVHRGDILAIIDRLDIAERARDRARRIVNALAEAEALVHRKGPDDVHFHEVGAVDSIVDMLGSAVALEILGVDMLTCGPLPLGRGFVRCSHGRMPLPAPATAYLLRGMRTIGVDRTVETVTPTGAAIVAALAEPVTAAPAMKLRAVGYGAGDRDDADVPNLVRLFLGEHSPAPGIAALSQTPDPPEPFMKIGIILSVVIVVALALIMAYNLHGVPDLPTAATTVAGKLNKAELPPNLPQLWGSSDAEGDANDAYEKVLDFYKENHRAIERSDAPTSVLDDWAGLLNDAMNAGKVTRPFMDNHLPLTASAEPDFGAGLESIDEVLLKKRAADGIKKGDAVFAYRTALNVFALGQRLFQDSERFDNRRLGLIMMMDAGEVLYQARDQAAAAGQTDYEKKLEAWAKALRAVQATWEEKVALVQTPHHESVADLINVAVHDQDPTWRIEATLQLGVAKHSNTSKANKSAIQAAIETGKKDSDPMIAGAAQAADAMTIDDVRKLK